MTALFNHHPVTANALGAAIFALCAGSATAQTTAVAAPVVPVAIKAADNERIDFIWRAVGTQNYRCSAKTAGGFEWAFTGPEADLFNAKGDKVGSHGAGPHWAAPDGSKVTGTVKARSPGTTAADIPWLLLATQSAGNPGKMAKVSSIQRINTQSGVAPNSGCDSTADEGKTVKQAYVSDYVFLTTN